MCEMSNMSVSVGQSMNAHGISPPPVLPFAFPLPLPLALFSVPGPVESDAEVDMVPSSLYHRDERMQCSRIKSVQCPF